MTTWRYSMVVLMGLSAGCVSEKVYTLPPATVVQSEEAAAAVEPGPSVAVAVAAGPVTVGADLRIAEGVQKVHELAGRLDEVKREFAKLKGDFGEKEWKAFTAQDSDRVADLLFRFLMCRDAAWELIRLYGDCQNNFRGDENQTRAFLIGFHAAAMIDSYSADLVLMFLDRPAVVRKMNEAFFRYEIPEGTYDRITEAVTAPDHIAGLRESKKFLDAETKLADSLLAKMLARDAELKALHEKSGQWYDGAVKSTDSILAKKSILLPETANLLRQNKLTREARRITKGIGDNLYAAQGVLYNNVSDIKQPATPPADFTPDQTVKIKSLLQPGDLIFTYTAGYMSNVFLPGKLKHGITYVGTPAQRAAFGLTAAKATGVQEKKKKKLEQDLVYGKLESGYDADVIEAVAEGVIFNSLDYLLKHHINRIVVLRPVLSQEDRVQALLNPFLLLGCGYDFDFDFVDSSFLCCTEVMYRSLHQRGGISFALVPRMGVQTLSADDIVRYYLADGQSRFEFVLMAEEKKNSPQHLVDLYTGDAGKERLKVMMNEQGFSLPSLQNVLPSIHAKKP